MRFPVTVVTRKPIFEAALKAVQSVSRIFKIRATESQLVEVVLNAQSVRCQFEPKSTALFELSSEIVVKWGYVQAVYWPRAKGGSWISSSGSAITREVQQ